MKISIDLDGTMWDHKSFFRELMIAFQSRGHQVGVLTGHAQESKESVIQMMKDEGFPAPDFYFGREGEEMNLNGAVSKSKKILREDIDIHFDDMDYDFEETIRLFKEGLGENFYRLMVSNERGPRGTHYE